MNHYDFSLVSLVGWFFDSSLKATLLLALALVMARVCKRAPANLRLGLLLMALLGAASLPVIGTLLPSWSLPLVPDPLGRGAATVSSDRGFYPARPSFGNDPVAIVSSTATPKDTAPPEETATPENRVSRKAGTELAASLDRTSGIAGPETTRRRIPPATQLIALLFSLGLAWSLLRQVAAHRRVHQLEKSSRTVHDDTTLAALGQARQRVGVTKPVRLLSSDRVTSPMTWGHRHPVVLLPSNHSRWSEERRAVVLHHELVHIRRSDWLVRVVARTVSAIYWFHPLAWITLDHIVVEQEHACDEEVLALGTRASSYAQHLLALARCDSSAPAPALSLPALPMARRSQLEVRLMSILSVSKDKSPLRRAALATCLLFLLTGLVPVLAAVQPWTPQTAAQQPPVTQEEALAKLAAAVREIEQLETKLEPHEARLEAIEAEMEPNLELAESTEILLEPFEQQLEAIELEMEPFEAELATIEAKLEPHETLLQEVELGLTPFENRLEEVEAELEPFEVQMAELESQLLPFEVRMKEAELAHTAQLQQLEVFTQRMEGEPNEAQRKELEALRLQLEPFQQQMEQITSEMEPVLEKMKDIHVQMEPVHKKMQQIHLEMEPVHQRMQDVHLQMEPVFKEMEKIHLEMEPIHLRMQDVHLQMEPVMARMTDLHVDMEPVHKRMEAVHQKMESVHAEMESLHARVEQSLEVLVDATLREELAPLGLDDGAIAAARQAALDSISFNINNQRLKLRGSASELGDEIQRALEDRGVSNPELSAASKSAARALLDLEIELDINHTVN